MRKPHTSEYSPARLYGTVLRIFDAGPNLADRYTVLPPRWAGDLYPRNDRMGTWPAIGAGPEPFHPQGVGYHCECLPGPHLGRRIKWADLPPDVQTFARQSFPEFAPAA